ncbi:MAG TPA: HEAT repeat domain-containing protein [Planctomycetota bacterium]|nr:HEAT repeat domain-containing protein [Planctomycetota bacterium]
MTTLAILLSLWFQAAAKPDDTAANEALEKFKTDYKAKESSARAAAVAALAATQADKIYVRLGQILNSSDEKEVRIAAAKGLGGATEDKKKVASILGSGINANAKDAAVEAAILEALGKLGDQSASSTVENSFKSKDVMILKAAVEAAGELKTKGSVPLLIDLMKRLEQAATAAPTTGGNYGGGKVPSVGSGGVTDDQAKERERVIKPLIVKVLGNLTKVNYNLAKEWEDWWRSEGGKFMSGK